MLGIWKALKKIGPFIRVRGVHSTGILQGNSSQNDKLVKPLRAKDLIKLVNESNDGSEKDDWRSNSQIPGWKRQKLALKEKFNGKRWNPVKKLSREQMEAVRLLKKQFPDMNASELGEHMKVSPEVIRRILKSNWEPSEEELEDLQQRWKKRGEKINEMYIRGEIGASSAIFLPKKKIVLSTNSTGSDFVISAKHSTNDTRNDHTAKRKKNSTPKGKNKLHLLLEK